MRECIHFDDGTVGLKGKIAADVIEFVDRFQNFLNRICAPKLLRRREAKLLQERKNLRVKIDIYSFRRTRPVKHHAERTLRHDGRIELLE